MAIIDRSEFDRPLDATALHRDPRILAGAMALHAARRPAMTGRIYGQEWDQLWAQYQLELLKEAQAVIWAIDKADRAPTTRETGT